MITATDLRGVVGIVPTPATPDAGRWDAEHTVNLPETERMVRAVIGDGITTLMTTGTFGECATLTAGELQEFVACVVASAGDAVPVFAGITTLNTRDTIHRGRALVGAGATGLFVGRPMWLAMDDTAIVRYYRDIAEALPGVPLVVYDNPPAFKGKISAEAYERLAAIPEVIAAKHTGGPALERDLVAVAGRLCVLPNAPDWYPVARDHPDLASACWSGAVACAPAAMAALETAVLGRDWGRAEEVSRRVAWAEEPMFAGGGLAEFVDYSIQLGHVRFQHAGLVDIGPSRPPYLEAPPRYVEGSVECGRRWAALQREFG
ncbi:dihydrodipicolinate synthase family protein [Actinomadura graeca]|uniref:Dihydrodipicolinate synthase family protein n=1 Tax=Actinomadura graeca TaxID=2750812 RepID=A0ABX8QQV4_9ACTN|nr:dihydrodipicolinate synthase family protein [Actinomadura graeca]QXJ21160.1 dihydrodipicolinate synthase family protein [Actinomadura graeca]